MSGCDMQTRRGKRETDQFFCGTILFFLKIKSVGQKAKNTNTV